ncbi:unnamed protein product, partial [Closterium sp. NIES-54]
AAPKPLHRLKRHPSTYHHFTLSNPSVSPLPPPSLSPFLQSVCRPKRAAPKPLHRLKRNPLKNRTAMAVLNPFAADKRKQLAEASGQPKTKKARETEEAKKAGEAWYQTMISDSDYLEFENFTKWLGVSE